MEPAEKAGSGEITIAISRSILSNKHSKAVRRMPDGLAAFRYFKIGLTACALSVCSLRSHPHSPFCRCATSSPAPGEDVTAGDKRGNLARERLRGRVRLTGVAPHPALRATFPRRAFQSFSTPGHPAVRHAAHSTSFSGLESFFRAASRRRAARLSAQRSI